MKGGRWISISKFDFESKEFVEVTHPAGFGANHCRGVAHDWPDTDDLGRSDQLPLYFNW